MNKYKVTVDLTWDFAAEKEYYVEALTAAKAKYKTARMMGNTVSGKNFKYFISLFNPVCIQIPDDHPTGFSIYRDEYGRCDKELHKGG